MSWGVLMSWQNEEPNNRSWNRFQSRAGYISFEYHSTWAYRSSKWRRKYSRCAMNPLRHTSAIHHLYYRRSFPRQLFDQMFRGLPTGESIAGAEIIGWDCLPLSDRCHDARVRRPGTAHHRDNWKTDRHSQLKNHNTTLFVWRYRLQFLGVYYWWVVFPVVLGVVLSRIF